VRNADRLLQRSFVLDRGWVASPVVVHPRWPGTYFALVQRGAGEAGPFIMNLMPSDVRHSTKSTLPAVHQMVSPYTAVDPPFVAPNGWVEPWTIHYGESLFCSLRLPSWLAPSPRTSSPPVQLALRMCEGTADLSADHDPLASNPTLDGIRSIDATFSIDAEVFWWSQDRFDGVTRYRSAVGLVDAVTSDPRPHLIRGLFDEHSLPLWM
jgi:hypothetical protein